MSVRVRLLDFLIFFPLGLFVGYLALAFVTDLRVHDLRPFIIAAAVKEGVQAGIEEYKKEFAKGQHLNFYKRQERDKALKRYVQRLDAILEAK